MSSTTSPTAPAPAPVGAGAGAEANHELLANERQPLTSATLTIRIIKSFTYRTSKNLVLRDVDLTKTTAGELMEMCKNGECERWQSKAWRQRRA